jgi:hypothetical protein
MERNERRNERIALVRPGPPDQQARPIPLNETYPRLPEGMQPTSMPPSLRDDVEHLAAGGWLHQAEMADRQRHYPRAHPIHHSPDLTTDEIMAAIQHNALREAQDRITNGLQGFFIQHPAPDTEASGFEREFQYAHPIPRRGYDGGEVVGQPMLGENLAPPAPPHTSPEHFAEVMERAMARGALQRQQRGQEQRDIAAAGAGAGADPVDYEENLIQAAARRARNVSARQQQPRRR